MNSLFDLIKIFIKSESYFLDRPEHNLSLYLIIYSNFWGDVYGIILHEPYIVDGSGFKIKK